MTKGKRRGSESKANERRTFEWWCVKFTPEEKKKKAPPFDHHGCIIVMGSEGAHASSLNVSDSLFNNETDPLPWLQAIGRHWMKGREWARQTGIGMRNGKWKLQSKSEKQRQCVGMNEGECKRPWEEDEEARERGEKRERSGANFYSDGLSFFILFYFMCTPSVWMLNALQLEDRMGTMYHHIT